MVTRTSTPLLELVEELPLMILFTVLLSMHFFFNAALVIVGIHIYAVDLAVLLVYAAALVKIVVGRETLRLDPVLVAFLVFVSVLVLAAAVGILHHHEPKSVSNDLKVALYLGVVFPATVLLDRRSRIIRLLYFGAALLFVAAAYDFFTRVTGLGYYPFNAANVEAFVGNAFFSRAYGLVTALPYYGIGLAAMLTLLIGGRATRRRQAAWFAAGVALLLLLVLQLLRGPLVGIAVALLVLVLLGRWRQRLALLAYAAGMTLLVVMVGLLITAPGRGAPPGAAAANRSIAGDLGQRASSIIDETASGAHAASTRNLRLNFVFGTMSELKKSGQLVLGRGLGYTPADRLQPSPGVEPFYPTLAYHSGPGWLLSKTGLLGFFVFGVLLLVFAVRVVWLLRRSASNFDWVLLAGSAAALGFLVGTASGENYLLQYPYAVPFVGIILAVPQIVRTLRQRNMSELSVSRRPARSIA